MKKQFSILLLLLSSLNVYCQSEKKITILFTNDLHSRIEGYAPEKAYTPLTSNDDGTNGGFSRIASIIKEEKNKSGETIVVDAGDFLMGTLFQSLEPETGFQLKLMRKMGYDVVCLGNHEFDYGPAKLASIVSSAIKSGPVPVMLLSNAIMSRKDPADDSLEKLFRENVIGKKFIIEREGLKIGFFSLFGKSSVENAAFAPPVTFSNQIPFAQKMAKELKAEGCDVIICLSHSGVSKGKGGAWWGEDVQLAGKVKQIDAIISGHTHTLLEEAIVVDGTPVVQAGEYARYVGKLEMIYDGNEARFESYSLIPVNDRLTGDIETQRLIDIQKKDVEARVLRPLMMDYDSPLAECDYSLECNEQGDYMASNLGPMVADAIQSYVNRHADGGTDISIVAVGVIRDRIVPGVQTAPDIFRLMSMGSGNDNVPGYPLARIYLTGKELKNMLEVMQAIYKSAPENFCFYSGIRVNFDPEKGLLKKISNIGIVRAGGKVEEVDFSKQNTKLYSVTANSYILKYMGLIKKKTMGLISVVPKDAKGNPIKDMNETVIDIDPKKEGIQEGKEWLSVVELLQSMKDTNGNGIPDIDTKYRRPVQTFFTLNSNTK